MNTKTLTELESLLLNFKSYWQDGVLNKMKVIEDLRNYNVQLISKLLENEYLVGNFVINVNGNNVIKIEEIVNLLQLKNYWMNSFTRFQNKIGLTTENKYLDYNSDVILNFPYKDCILEGGMSKEQQGKDETFYNKVIAKEELDVLLEPKVLSTPTKFSENGEEVPSAYSGENMLIKGNNLVALHSLKGKFSSQVKLIYIDPPYNTGGDGFKYNDKFNHSTWLTFMKNRLEVAKDLLTEDGTIWISIDDDEQAYLKVLCDEVFGRNNFVNNIIWEKRYSPTNDSKWLSDSHDFILVYAKNKGLWKPNLLPRTDKQNKYYKHDDEDGRGKWRSDNVLVKSFSKSGVFPIKNPNTGVDYYPPEGSCYRFSKETAEKLLSENRLYFGKDGKGAPQLKRYLSEVKQGVTPMTIWFRDDVTDNQEAKKEINQFKFSLKFDTPKPEKLIERILHIATNQGDLVLDFFAGSGTTLAVAMKMNRKFIGVEQMDYVDEITVPRLKKVIEGEQGGISKDYDWSGAGSFIYSKIASYENVVSKIESSNSIEELKDLYEELNKKYLIDYRVNDFFQQVNMDEIKLDEVRKLFIEILDPNQLYISYFEILDNQYNFTEETISFNQSFYSGSNNL
ncbi:DNA methyltransferase [Priestia megaterium]